MSVRAGTRGATVGRLNPAGEVVVDDIRHPARAAFGALDPGTPIVVVGSNEFGLVVRPVHHGEPELGPGLELSTPVERIEERADDVSESLDEIHDELRNYFLVLLALPVLGGMAFGGIGYWAGDLTGAVVGGLLGIGFGTGCLLKMWLAS